MSTGTISHLPGELRVRYGQGSNPGTKLRNDDALGIKIPDGTDLITKGVTAVIADGVSTAEAGGEAAQLSVLGFLNDYYSTPETWTTKTAGGCVLTAINRWLYSEGRRLGNEDRGYLATFSALVLKSRTAHLFHVGDSRIYLLRNGALEQLTRDHASRVSGKASYLGNALGLDLNLRVDYQQLSIHPGDVFFLTTDGIHDALPHDALTRALRTREDNALDDSCAALIEDALARGSSDNLSSQIIVVDSLERESQVESYRELERLPFPPDLDPGVTFEGYRIDRLMHASSRSQLYLATDPDLGHQVVIKTPSVNYSDDPAYIDRFLMEEWIGRRLSNKHLIRMLRKKAAEPRFLYHVMEYVEGRSLKDWIRCNTRPSVKEVVEIVEGIITGLRAMHRRETLHGDLKPDNIMIDPEGVPRIIDFGSAYVAGIREVALPYQRGLALGTARYSAPEYRLGCRPTNRSDLFSLAMITYEMLTHGQRPFGERFENANAAGEFSRLDYLPAAKHNPLVTTWVDGALKRALSWNPTRRQDCLSEFLADLKNPNPDYILPSDAPLLAKNPVAFWKGLSVLLSILVLVLLFLLASQG